jgi:putative transposase
MTLFNNKYRIESARLKGYDYSSPGEYFVTICTGSMIECFGDVMYGEMKRNDVGEIAHQMWMNIPNHHEHAMLDEFIVMPNHVHGIVVLCENDHVRDAINRVSTGGTTKSKNPMLMRQSLPYIIRQYKGRVSFEIHKTNPDFFWQPRFYDHIIRDEKGLNAIREYIKNNPAQWEYDRNDPSELYKWKQNDQRLQRRHTN